MSCRAEAHVTLQGAATWRIQYHVIAETCYIVGCSHLANSMSSHPRDTSHIPGCCCKSCHPRDMLHISQCCHLACSVSCHPISTCHIAGSCHLGNSVSSSQSHVSHCRVMSLSLLSPVIRQPRVTLQGAATLRVQCRHPRAMCYIARCCHLANSMSCHPTRRHIAGCCNPTNYM